MKDLLRAFLAFLRLNRNASAHTVRAYESDLSQFPTYLAAELKRPRPELQPADITRPMIRGFLAELFRRGESRASAARKLAAIRTFLRYLRREGLIEADPGLLVVDAQARAEDPAAPRGGRDDAAARDAGHERRRSAGATARFSSCSTPRACASASWWRSISRT